MGLFTKYCEVCGKKIGNGNHVVRYGKHFDSEEHAEQYIKMIREKKQASLEGHAHPGGCCCSNSTIESEGATPS